MRRLIPLTLKVEIMTDRLLRALLPTAPHRRQTNLHIELSPSFLLDLERRGFNRLLRALTKGLVQEVEGLLVAVGGDVVAVGADEVDLDAPFAEGDFAFGDFGVAGRVGVSGG